MSTASTPPIRFDDGAAYERQMGRWSRAVGEVFLDWLSPPGGLRWLDVGCGNGAFTELVVERCTPSRVDAIDPSEGQLAYARTRPGTRAVHYAQGDAMRLPCPDREADVAVMALVLFFVPDPAKGVAEMVRATRPGGTLAAYAWDMHGGGFPLDALSRELHAAGHPAPKPPSVDASRLEVMASLWRDAGLEAVETRQIEVERRFEDFDDWWASASGSATMGAILRAMPAGERDRLQDRVKSRLPAAADGSITHAARANAVKGRIRKP